jgi:hypothetical protein
MGTKIPFEIEASEGHHIVTVTVVLRGSEVPHPAEN